MVSNGVFTFVYDGLNRLVQVQQQSAIVATYGYDSSNRRIRKTVGTTITHYLYDLNNHLIAERLANGTTLREYIYLDGEPIALKEYQTNPGLYYHINDHLGTPQQLVTTTGTVLWQAAYQPYGQAQVTVATVKNNLRFPGQYFDAETGLHYNWNRYYDSDTGRYISADPIGLRGGMNLYAYVEGNPVNWIDPSGLDRTLEQIIAHESSMQEMEDAKTKYAPLGTPYAGANATKGKGADCSGSLYVTAKESGLKTPYFSTRDLNQIGHNKEVDKYFYERIGEPQRGDYIVFPHHVVYFKEHSKSGDYEVYGAHQTNGPNFNLHTYTSEKFNPSHILVPR